MKIIAKSNFDNESVNDFLVCENVKKEFGKYIVAKLNEKYSGENRTYFYVLVSDDYTLYKFEP
jgi:hypothetical protein